MKISARADYACKAVLELSLHWPKEEPLPINIIAQKQNIPIRFLTHILLSLKQLGLVQSSRGKAGGYVLLQSPKDIHLSQIILHFSEWTSHKSPQMGARKPINVFNIIWKEFDETMLQFLEKITFEDLLERNRDLENVPMFVI